MTSSFKFFKRGVGHWDVCDENGRIFAIRGGPGAYYYRDSRENPGGPGKISQDFCSLAVCLADVFDKLTFQNIVVEGVPQTEIPSWNISQKF